MATDRKDNDSFTISAEGMNMSWKRQFIEHIADTLRFIGYMFLFFDAIILSVFTLWFTAKFIWFFARWLNRVMFQNPW